MKDYIPNLHLSGNENITFEGLKYLSSIKKLTSVNINILK
jgi:hypothetical protein